MADPSAGPAGAPARALVLPRWWNQANKTEQAYYATQLGPRLQRGELVRVDFEAETLLLGDDLRYTPDFRVVPADGLLEFHEVKGPYKREDAIVKLRTAPELHPHRFFLCELMAEGKWRIQEVGR